MLRITSLILAVVCFFGMIILIVGYRSEPEYKNSLIFESSFSVQYVWQEIMNIKKIPNRKKDVTSIEIIEEYGKLFAWKENLKTGGSRTYRINQIKENERLVIELTDSSYGLKGMWTFNLEDYGENTLIKIDEESIIEDKKMLGWRIIFGRDHDLLVWQKYITVGLTESLLNTQ